MNLPVALTISGLIFGLAGVFLFPHPAGCVLLVLSVAIDGIDGWTARRLGQCTDLGARLDWSTDVTIAYLLLVVMVPFPYSMGAIALLTVWHYTHPPFHVGGTMHYISGRALLTGIALSRVVLS